MSYDTVEETGDALVASSSTVSGIEYRALSETLGEPSAWYRARTEGSSGEVRLQPQPPRTSWHPASKRKEDKGTAQIANREHIARLLRACGKLTQSLKHTEDRADAVMAGAVLCDMLEEIWQHRQAREDDWIELLNALQIILRGELFEAMSKSKKEALATLFAETLVARTISRAEVARGVQLLADAGFDLWRGLEVETVE